VSGGVFGAGRAFAAVRQITLRSGELLVARQRTRGLDGKEHRLRGAGFFDSTPFAARSGAPLRMTPSGKGALTATPLF